MHYMKPQFWSIVVAVLLTGYLLAAFVIACGPPRARYEPPGIQADIARHLIAVVWLGVVWAIIFRSEVESRRISLRSLFALLTIQGFGFWLARVTSIGF
jgi:hypothetical protein